MARKKRINKLVLLIMTGLVLLVGLAVAWHFRRPIRDYFFPEEPDAIEKRADAAFEAGNYLKAARDYGIATYWFKKSDNVKDMDRIEFKLSRAQVRLALTSLDLTGTERGEYYHGGKAGLRRLLRRSPKHRDALQLLCEVAWGEAVRQQRAAAWDAYVADCTKLLALAPDDHQSWYRRGLANAQLALDRKGKYIDAAEADFRRAIEVALKAKSDTTAYWVRLAGFLHWRGRPDEANKVYRDALQKYPDNAELRVSYAAYLRSQDKSDKALEQLRLAIKRKPNDVVGHIALGSFYRAEGNFKGAMKALLDAKKIDDSDFRVYGELATIFTQQKEPEKAVETLRNGLAVIKHRSESQPATRESQRRRIENAKLRLASMLANSLLDMVEAGHKNRDKLLEEARERLTQIEELAAEGPLRAKVAGRIALADGDSNKAIKLLEEAYNSSTTLDGKTVNLLINLYLREGLRGKAEEILDRILRFQRNAATLVAKALLLVEYRQYTRAEEALREALRVDPQHAEARNLLLALRTTDTGGSLPAALKPTPKVIRLILDRAGSMMLTARPAEALRLVEELSRKVPADRLVVARLVNMYMAGGGKDKAKAVLRRAMAADPNSTDDFSAILQAVDATPQQRLETRMAKADKIEDKLERALTKAMVCAMARKPKQYLKYLHEAAAIRPSDPRVVTQMFRYALDTRDWKVAEEQAATAKAGDLDGCEGKLYAADLAAAKEDWAGAIAELEASLKYRPEMKQARVLLGQCYLRIREPENAERAFRQAADADPAYSSAAIGMAKTTEAQGKWPEHAEWVDKAYRLSPHDPYIRERRLLLMEEKAKPAEIIKDREKILAQNPGDMQNRLRLGALYERVNRPRDAEGMYRALFASNAGTRRFRARALAGFYARQTRFGDVDTVYANLLAKITDDAEKVGAYVDYGWLLALHSDELATAAFKKAIEVNEKDPRGHFAMGRYMAQRRRWLEAAGALTRYMDLRPEDRAAEKELVRLLIDANRFDDASRHLRKLVAADASDATAIALKGLLEMRKGNMDAAEKAFNQAISENPNHSSALVYRAQLYLFQGQHTKAKTDLEAAGRLTKSPDILMQLARFYVSFRDLDSAESIFRDILRERRGYAPAIDGLVGVYMAQKNWRDLEPLLAEGKKMYPKAWGYYIAEAGMWQERGDLSRAVAAQAEAFKLAPNSPRAVRAYLLGLLATKQYKKILDVAQPYANREPYSSWVAAISAHALVKLKKPAEAEKLFIAALERATQLDITLISQQAQDAYGLSNAIAKLKDWLKTKPKGPNIYFVLGGLHILANEPRQGIEVYQRAFDLADGPGQRAWAKFRQGVAHYRMDNVAEAIKAFEHTLKLDPNNIETLNNLAYLYTDRLNKPTEALPYAETAFKRMPNNANVLDTYGWTLAKMGEYDKAERYLNRSLQTGGARATGLYHLGWVHEQTGLLTQAGQRYDQALELAVAAKDKHLQRAITESMARLKKKQKAGGSGE